MTNSTDQDIFGTTTPNTGGDPSPAQSNPFSDKLEQIKNEHGEPKYKDVDTALDALNASQQFIEQLKAEKAAVEQAKLDAEARLNQMGSIEDFVNRVRPDATPAAPQVETPPAQPQGLDETKVAELLEHRLQQRETSQREQQNLEQVIGGLKTQYGDAAAQVIKDKAVELGTTTDELQNLAKKNPAMVMTLLGGTHTPSPTPSSSTVIPPVSVKNDNPMPTIEKGRGAARGGHTSQEMTDMWKKVATYTNNRLGVTN